MGSLLTAAVPGLRVPEEANLRAPEAVVSVHVSFINAGADVIETNTFGANRRTLDQHYLADEFESINCAAVKMAGVPARGAAERLRTLGLAAFGANLGRGPAAALEALAEMESDG